MDIGATVKASRPWGFETGDESMETTKHASNATGDPPKRMRSGDREMRRVQSVAGPVVEAADFDLIELRVLIGPRGTRRVQLFIDRWPGRGRVTLDDCAEISRKVMATFELETDLCERYALEVSSPGMNRLLRHADDIRRFKGNRARVTTIDDDGNKQTLIGELVECDEQFVKLDLGEPTPCQVQRSIIQRAVLDPTLDQWSRLGELAQSSTSEVEKQDVEQVARQSNDGETHSEVEDG
jgi:ribosome maturation factor RimP